MGKHRIIQLTDDQRQELEKLIGSGHAPARTQSRALILLLLDRSQGKRWLDREVAEAVRRRVQANRSSQANPSEWVLGGGWNPSIWADGIAPHRILLDEVAPDVPVVLDSKDLHGVWANTTALRRAGIGRDTPDVAGGIIERDGAGEPTGILRENATELLSRAIPKPGLAETTRAWLLYTSPSPRDS